MRPRRPIDEASQSRLQELLKNAKNKADFQRVQCVWLRACLDLDSSQVSRAVGWSAGRVKQIWAQYLTQGEKSLLGSERGGRYHQNLSLEDETALLRKFEERAERGQVLVVAEVKAAYEAVVRHAVAESTVYRLLARHGWRKIAPRPHHPQGKAENREEFKKNSRRWSKTKPDDKRR